jgi:predicted ATP-dependent protease
VHGLAVVGVGDDAFGHPVRITATAGVGREGVVDIERQAELGGRLHSKGVLILGGYLSDTYAADKPLALAARLVFEQSYQQVEGDSASLAELVALLSRLAEVPVRQGIAVTGSVNQRGQVQAVGGVNEKVEGFFDACQAVEASDDQGVILPASNVEHLMLRDDVVEAVAAGRFRVHAVATVDEALEIVTGRPAADVHARVNARLRALAETLSRFATPESPVPNGRAARPPPAGVT